MIPYGCETVTLCHRSGAGYARHVLHGCSWRQARVRSVNGLAVSYSDETTCRIPAGQQMPDAGDVLILGDVNVQASSEIELVRQLEALRDGGAAAFRVRTVRDNSRGAPMPHYAATGG